MSKGIYVPLTPEEWSLISRLAEDDCREPRQEARKLIREALIARGFLDPEAGLNQK